MTYRLAAFRTTLPYLMEPLKALFAHSERRSLGQQGSDFTRQLLDRMDARLDQVQSFYPIDKYPPPYDSTRTIRFDVWGRTWVASSDSFTWERFPNAYCSPESSTIGAKIIIDGLPDYTKNYKLVYWTTIPAPPEYPEKDLTLYNPLGQKTA